jgi:hypothetical protein
VSVTIAITPVGQVNVAITPVQAVSVTVTPLGEGAETVFPPLQPVILPAVTGTILSSG